MTSDRALSSPTTAASPARPGVDGLDGSARRDDVGRDEERALASLRCYGSQATSFQTLEPGLRHAFDEDGFVGFVDTGGAWVTAGAPIGPAGRTAEQVKRFLTLARERRKRACFFGVEPGLAERTGLCSLAIGAEPCWDPRRWHEVVARSRSLREQLRRARAKGVTIREIEAEQLQPGSRDRRRIIELARRWLQSRSMAPMSFLVRLDLFGHAEERLYLGAERDGELVGVLVAVPIYQRQGWLVEDLLRTPESPNGTSELLIAAAMQRFAERACPLVSMGLAPLAGEVSPVLGVIRALTGWLYDFEGVRAFKQKLGPTHWQPLVVAFPASSSRVRVVLDTLTAFADGGLLSFALATLRRQRRKAAAWVGLLWLTLSAIVPLVGGRWFPAITWRASWVALGVATALIAFTLARRWRPRLAWGLSVLLGLQSPLAAIQLWQLRGTTAGVLDLAMAVGAIMGPAVAALLVAHAALVDEVRLPS